MHTLMSLEALQQFLGIQTADALQESRLMTALFASTRAIERLTHRAFLPYRATLAHIMPPNTPSTLPLQEDLLMLLSVLDGEGHPYPLEAIRLAHGIAHFQTPPCAPLQLYGVWGWHDHWQHAWQPTHDRLQSAIEAETLLLSVADADSEDASMGQLPRFQVGQLLACEDEYLRVLAVNGAQNTLTVLRGANGTLAQPHADQTPLMRFVPPYDLAQACLQLAGWFYKYPDSPSGDLPLSLKTLLRGFMRVSV